MNSVTMERLEKSLTVKSTFGIDIKRFDIPSGSTLSDLLQILSSLYNKEKLSIRYKDEDGDLIVLTTEEEYSEALKSVPKTGDILRLYLDDKGKIEVNIKSDEKEQINGTKSLFENQTLVNPIEKPSNPNNTPTSSLQRKPNTCYPKMKWRKIESASKLSKDVNFDSLEVTGREPVKPRLSDEASHLSSQKPGCRKVRRMSSGNNNSDRNEKKSCRGRPERRQHKRKRHSISSSSSSSNRSSSGSSSSSSAESSSEDERSASRDKNTRIQKRLMEFEKEMLEKVNKAILNSKDEIKKELTPQIIQDMLLRLDGAVIQSVPVNNAALTPENSAIPKDGRRARYHHQNVICDICQNEIIGPRYKCGNCSDYDLCENCEQIEGIHTPSHVFLKINYPSVHCGRRSISGKSRPLLSTNIYEEREKEREREELLQRKLDSGSELSVKKVEKMEKQRLKRKEAERTRENKEARKEEWRNLKRELKEVKKRKKELKKKVKKHVKVYKNEKRAKTVTEEQQAICDNSIKKTNDSVTLQDENLSQALSGLKFVENCTENTDNIPKVEEAIEALEVPKLESLVFVEPANNSCAVDDGNVSDATDKTDSDVMIVARDPQISMDIITDQMSNVDLSKKPDLVDFDTDVAESVASEDFIVVSKYFDLSTPLDDQAILQHEQYHENNGTTCDDFCLNDSYPADMRPPSNMNSDQQLPVDLVASVPEPTLQSIQPDIALSTAPVPPGEVTMVRDNSLISMASDISTSENNSEAVQLTHISSTLSMDSITSTETLTVVSKQPEPCDVISTQPTLHEQIKSLKQNVDVIDIQPNLVEKPITLLQQAEGLQNVAASAEVAVSAETDGSISEEPSFRVSEDSLKFNPPSEKFMKDMHKQREQETCQSTTTTTVTDGNVTTTTTTTPNTTQEVSVRSPSFAGVITDVIGSVVDVAASAASAIGVTNNPKTPTQQVHYSNSSVTIPSYKEEEMILAQLQDMGFFDNQYNLNLLRRYKGDINKCVEELLKVNDSNWHQTRH